MHVGPVRLQGVTQRAVKHHDQRLLGDADGQRTVAGLIAEPVQVRPGAKHTVVVALSFAQQGRRLPIFQRIDDVDGTNVAVALAQRLRHRLGGRTMTEPRVRRQDQDSLGSSQKRLSQSSIFS